MIGVVALAVSVLAVLGVRSISAQDTGQAMLARVATVTLLAGLLAGCGANWRTTTYDPRRACQSFGGGYSERNGTCRSGAP